MWISLFTLACGAAVCLSVAAILMERGGRPRAARLCFVHDRYLPRANACTFYRRRGDCPFAQIIVS
jgi:hypothetical protein